MAKRLGIFLGAFILFCSSTVSAQIRPGFEPLAPGGPGVLMETLEPALRKWYVPQELYHLFGWEQWRYSNYARNLYERYVDVALEGYRYYDIYGNYITRGWRIFDWSQEQPRDFGSSIFKSPKFSSWFNNLLVSSTGKGQYHIALTIGEQIRTTLTPLTFSKPTFNGVQLDFLSDKYAMTVLASRVNDPGIALLTEFSPPRTATDFVNLVGLRGTVQLGDFAELGGTYVNASIGKSLDDWAENSLKGRLSTGQNAGRVRTITIKLSDDSPGDGEAGAMLFAERIFIDGRDAWKDIRPVIKGGIMRKGRYEANGDREILLIYDISGWSYVDEKGVVRDINWFKKVSFALVLANDYKVEVTSNLQVDATGQEIFLPVTRAPGNVKDATNQKVVRFDYGLPTGNEIYGLTFELTDVLGFWLRGEWNINRRHRRFPNVNPEIIEHSLATDRSRAFYLTAAKLAYPWFAYGEVFNIDSDYSTTMYIVDKAGRIFYDDKERYVFEFIDDNDDQDRFPDWNRNTVNQRAGNDVLRREGIFPGLDENNDWVSDFNQNMNFQPDYEEPFLRYNVDPPEFLFGVDMNNNTVIDRFENDNEPDYPYKRDHRGYNVYVGAEVTRGVKLSVGHLSERLLSSDRRSKSSYVLLTVEKSFPGVGDLRVFDNARVVRDNIPDDLLQWEQLPNTLGAMVPFEDPLICQNTTINTAYADFYYTGIDRFDFINKIKYETHRQRKSRPELQDKSDFLGVINKAGYTLRPLENLVLQPRWKSMFRCKTPFKKGELEEKELWEIASLYISYPLLEHSWIELGAEFTQFLNLVEKPAFPPPGYVDDFRGLVLALQFSNVVDYLGYKLTSKVGFRQQTRYFEDRLRTGSVLFVKLYAGIEE